MPVLSNKNQSSNSASITEMERVEKSIKLPQAAPESPKEFKKKKKPPKFLDSIHQMQKNTLLNNDSFSIPNKVSSNSNVQAVVTSIDESFHNGQSATS